MKLYECLTVSLGIIAASRASNSLTKESLPMPTLIFKVHDKKGRWSVFPPSSVNDHCDVPPTNTKQQAISVAREIAVNFAPAIIEVLESNGSLSERIFVDR